MGKYKWCEYGLIISMGLDLVGFKHSGCPHMLLLHSFSHEMMDENQPANMELNHFNICLGSIGIMVSITNLDF
jgi:hypothetical protein